MAQEQGQTEGSDHNQTGKTNKLVKTVWYESD